MSRVTAIVVALAAGMATVSPVGHACGDKFMMAGRGPRFQKVYASVYPGQVLIYATPSSDRRAAIRNPQLHKMLRQAGHTVTVVEAWPQLEQEMKRQAVDVLLADVSESARLAPVMPSLRGRPEAMYVAFSKNKTAVPSNQVCRLKASDDGRKYLEEIESVMKARTKLARVSQSGSGATP
jgi:CheY-like chemotaxis protein